MGLETIGEIIIAVLVAEVIIELLKVYFKKFRPGGPDTVIVETRAVVDEYIIKTPIGTDGQTEEGNREDRKD